jgi:hypothetical protein
MFCVSIQYIVRSFKLDIRTKILRTEIQLVLPSGLRVVEENVRLLDEREDRAYTSAERGKAMAA